MSTEADRRADGSSRMPFEALVEVGGAVGPAFEAQAVDVSEEGMHLRTAYLPEAGQPLTCRFDTGTGDGVMASGEVVWTQNAGKGGEFGIRFTDVDADSIEALRRMCGIATDPPEGAPAPTASAPGTKVRLHIEGLASPMRARVKGSEKRAVTVGSDLGFLQVGKELALEDAESGTKRPAKIDRVDVVVDPTSHIPQLVVTLRYADDAGGAVDTDPSVEVHEDPPQREERAESDGDLERIEKATNDMKGTIARGVAAIGPTFAKMSNRAKTTIALLAAKRHAAEEREAPRRTTAAAPGGGLHTAGRRVVRGGSDPRIEDLAPKLKITKGKVVVAGAAVIATIIGVVAFRHPANATDGSTASSDSDPAGLLEAKHFPPIALPTAAVTTPVTASPGSMAGAPSMMGAEPEGMGGAEPEDMSDDGPAAKKKHGKVAPFGNGPVSHGNVLHLKMDGAIAQIQGAAQPTGFTVKVPGRKPLEAAGPLASRDGRIAAVKVTNDAAGAELTVSFKDGVPNYQVRAKGDTLEIALAPMGKAHGDKAVAKKGDGAKHHAKKHHDKGTDKGDKQ